nr:STAS domain-containing protein [Lachnospiraceae bacterium]
MNIQTKQEDRSLTVILEGRLDTSTAPQLEECLNSSLEGIENLSLDLSALDYISSAGLRVLLSAQKRMMKQGQMQITGANETVMEIFEITGFSDILTIL